MRSPRLALVLAALNVGLLLVAVAGVASVAVLLLRGLADEQARARVEHSAASARNAVQRAGEEVLTRAHVLAGRPTLARLVEEDPAALPDYLDRFQRDSRLDGTAVLAGGRLVASTGPRADWNGGPGSLFRWMEDGTLGLFAWADSPLRPEVRVGVLLRLDADAAQRISREIGAPMSLRREAPPASASTSAVALRNPGGETAGFVEASLPPGEIDRSVQRIVGILIGLSAALGILGALASALLGARLSRPLAALSEAAGRIGHGDLATPVPSVGGAEIGALAESLEEMRRSLLRLTADLRRQQAESDAIVTGIVEGVFTVDRERRLQFLNPQAAAMLGTEVQAALGRFCGDVLRPLEEEGERPCESRCPILHARFQPGARAVERLEGGRTVVITSASPVDSRQMQVMRDETEVESSRRARDTVLATISHEFRTPLSAQLASIELLLDELPTLSTAQTGELVLSLQRGTLRLTQLIDNLLESVRLESGQFALRRRPVCLDDVVEQALELTRPLLALRRQQGVVDLPYPFPVLCADGPRLTQVLVNLLANANKYGPPDSAIRIGAAAEADTVRFWVDDGGPGLPVGLPFAPFARSGPGGGEPEARGAGLGLWIVKSIVERHGGRVEAESGRVSVILPRGASDEDPCG